MSDTPRVFFENGSSRSEYAPMYDLVPKEAIDALADRMGFGYRIHGEENWKKGGPLFFQETRRHAMTHYLKYLDGWTDDNHLEAAFTNLMMLVYWERKGKALWQAPPLQAPPAPVVLESYDPVLEEIIKKNAEGKPLDDADKTYVMMLQRMVMKANADQAGTIQ